MRPLPWVSALASGQLGGLGVHPDAEARPVLAPQEVLQSGRPDARGARAAGPVCRHPGVRARPCESQGQVPGPRAVALGGGPWGQGTPSPPCGAQGPVGLMALDLHCTPG